MARRPVKQSLRQKLADNVKAESYVAAMHGKPLRSDAGSMLAEMKPYKPRAANPEIPSESAEQRAFVKWFRLQYPDVRIFAIPNGGARDVITGSILKAEGVEPGVPDLFVPALRLFIEMKRIRNYSISPEQEEWERYLKGCGYSHFFAMGCDDAIAKVREFLAGGIP